jgi:hypothetical protein
MKQAKQSPEYTRFENLLRNVIQVSHSELKLRIDEDKRNRKHKRAKTSPASRVSSDKD